MWTFNRLFITLLSHCKDVAARRCWEADCSKYMSFKSPDIAGVFHFISTCCQWQTGNITKKKKKITKLFEAWSVRMQCCLVRDGLHARWHIEEWFPVSVSPGFCHCPTPLCLVHTTQLLHSLTPWAPRQNPQIKGISPEARCLQFDVRSTCVNC